MRIAECGPRFERTLQRGRRWHDRAIAGEYTKTMRRHNEREGRLARGCQGLCPSTLDFVSPQIALAHDRHGRSPWHTESVPQRSRLSTRAVRRRILEALELRLDNLPHDGRIDLALQLVDRRGDGHRAQVASMRSRTATRSARPPLADDQHVGNHLELGLADLCRSWRCVDRRSRGTRPLRNSFSTFRA